MTKPNVPHTSFLVSLIVSTPGTMLLDGWCHLLLLIALSLLHGTISTQEYRWKDLTQAELEQWYSPTDLCVLNTTDKFSFPQDTRANDCSHLSRGNRRVHCSVGMGNNRQPCFGPFGAGRPHFKMGLEGFTNYSSKPLIEAFNHFIDTNTTLVLLGDSTTRQKLQAMQCEIEREDHKIRTNGNIWGILPCNTKYYIYLPGGRSFYVRIVSMGPNSADCLKGGRATKAIANGVFENAAYVIDRENNVYNRSVFVVANMGLWYNDEQEYAAVVPATLDWLEQVATSTYPSNLDLPQFNLSLPEETHVHPLLTSANIGTTPKSLVDTARHAALLRLKNTVVWHESFSQHWANPWGSGYFAKPSVEYQVSEWTQHAGNYSAIPTVEYVSPFCCRAITNTSHMADWRNDIVNTQLKKVDSKYKNINLFPMADITRPLVDMHTCNARFFHDCTHYCFSPLMFQPFWHQLAAMATGKKTP